MKKLVEMEGGAVERDKLNVLHVITGLGDGGAEAVLYRLVTHDSEDNHHVISLSGEGKYGDLLRQHGVNVVALCMPRGRLTLSGCLRLWRYMRNCHPDLVQTWMYHSDLLGGIFARLTGLPVVWGIHNTLLVPGRSSRSTIFVAQLCSGIFRRIPQKIIACAQSAAEVHNKLGYDGQRMVVIPNGYELFQFMPKAELRYKLRTEWGISNDVPIVGMVARFDPYKDHANLFAALGILKRKIGNFKLVLVGVGIDCKNSELKKYISLAGLGEDTYLLGQRNDIPAVMNAIDVHVLSSTAEAFPNVLAEAMACGTPCVSTDVGDAKLIIGDTGIIVEAQNAPALSDAIGELLSEWREPCLWKQRQKACWERINQKFSISNMVRGYRAVWGSVK